MSAAPPADPAIGLGQIEAADPSFELELFKRQAADVFVAVKQGIESQDLSAVMDQVTANVYDDLRVEVMGLEARGGVRSYEGVSPISMVVAAANCGPDGDAITLQIRSAAPQDLGAFTEYWTFTRPPQATRSAASRNECPNCGAPIDIDTGRICRFCRTLLPNRQAPTGWLVAAIRPAQENLS